MFILHEKDHCNLPTDAGTGPAIIFFLSQVCLAQEGPVISKVVTRLPERANWNAFSKSVLSTLAKAMRFNLAIKELIGVNPYPSFQSEDNKCVHFPWQKIIAYRRQIPKYPPTGEAGIRHDCIAQLKIICVQADNFSFYKFQNQLSFWFCRTHEQFI